MKEQLTKKAKRVANIIALVAFVFNALMFGVFAPEAVSAATVSQGPNNGSVFPSSGYAWANPANAAASDNVYASNGVTSGTTATHKTEGFGFNIPAGSVINGIEANVERRSATANCFYDGGAMLIKDGTTPIISSNQVTPWAYWPTTDTVKTYGGSANLWNQTWTASEINSSNFGFAIYANKGTCSGMKYAYIDNVSVKVYYTLPDTTAPKVVLSATQVSPTNVAPINMTATFDEAVTGFTSDDVSVTNGTVSNFTGSGTNYTFDINPIAQGTVAVNVASGAAQDAALNGNDAAEEFSVIYDTEVLPFSSVNIKSDNVNQALAKVGDTVTVSFTASEEITTPDVLIAGNVALVSGVYPDLIATYTMDETDTEGPVLFSISNYQDNALNSGAAVSTTTDGSYVVFDKTAPTGVTEAVIDATNPTNNNNPNVYGKFALDLNQNVALASVDPTIYDISKIDIVFDNGTDKYVKQAVSDYVTGQFTTEGVGGYQMVTSTVVPAVVPAFLPDGTYKVTAIAYDWTGNFTEFLVENDQVIDTVAPEVVKNLVVTGKTDTTVSLKWDSVVDAAGYKIYYGTTEGVWTGVKSVGNVTSYTVSGLNANTNYFFKVVAFDAAMNDAQPSNIVSDRTNETPVVLASSTGNVSGGNNPAPEGQILGDTDEKKDEGNTENKDEKKEEDKNNGFSWWWIIILLIIAGGGYYYYTVNPTFFKKFGKGPNPPSGI